MRISCGKLVVLFLVLAVLGWIALKAFLAAFGWVVWVALLVLVVALALSGKYLFRQLLLTPFRMKGRVLQGAECRVLRVEHAGTVPVEDGGEDGAPAVAHRYLVEAEITPKASGGGGFQLWEPGELRASVPGSRPDAEADENDLGSVGALQIWDGTSWVEDEGGKYPGPQRLRLTFDLPRPVDRFVLRYYFEDVGEVRTPPVIDI